MKHYLVILSAWFVFCSIRLGQHSKDFGLIEWLGWARREQKELLWWTSGDQPAMQLCKQGAGSLTECRIVPVL